MKTLKLPIRPLVIAMAFALVLSSCEKDNIILQQGTENLSSVSVKADQLDPNITILPSGDVSGVTDTDAIDLALNNLPSGGVLLLESGTFYINREIFVPEFSGTMIGRGMNETEIRGVGDDITPFTFDQFFVFLEPAGGLEISHMSFTLPDGFTTSFGFGSLNAFIFVQLTAAGSDTTFDHLILTGTDAVPGSDPIFGSQPNSGIVVEGDFSSFPNLSSGGHHMVSNSIFSKQAFFSLLYQGFKGATIGVHNNLFTEIKSTVYRWMSGSSVSITNNDMDTFSFGAIIVTQEGNLVPGDPNAIQILNNSVQSAGFMPIEIGWIPDGGANFDVQIEKNDLTNLGFDPLGFFSSIAGIGIFYGNNGAIVRNNKINGEAYFGILSEGDLGIFQANQMNSFTPFQASYGLFGSYNTVINPGNETMVDLGIGNITTGMPNIFGESIGERLKEAQRKRKEILDVYNIY